jgi:uncharacterized protein YjiS (DUF1127 family)
MTQSVPHRLETNTWLAGARVALRQTWSAYWRYRRRRAATYLLHSLSDRTLQDIGLHRSEIESAVYGRRGERSRRYDAVWE